jgi:large subunit ribosomal protein L4
MQTTLYSQAGEQVGTIELNEYIFGIEPNVSVMHQYVVMQHANARLGTHNTRGRGEVAGSTRKLYRQKGTGRARQGSARAPHRKGGGVAHGPHPRKYTKAMPRKMRRLAVRSALSAKFAADAIRFLEGLAVEQPRTKDMVALLAAHGFEGKTLIVLPAKDYNIQKSASNLPHVQTLLASYLNVRDLLKADHILMLRDSLETVESILGNHGSRWARPSTRSALTLRLDEAATMAPASPGATVRLDQADARQAAMPESASPTVRLDQSLAADDAADDAKEDA